jgi:molecular chaperone DnaK
MESEDPERIRARSQDLTEAAMKLGEAIYKAQQAEESAAPEAETGTQDDGIVDADFEELGDNDRKN